MNDLGSQDAGRFIDGAKIAPGSVLELLQKYTDLCSKYERAVEKLKQRSVEESGAFHLAWWAMRTLSSALAVFRGNKLVIANTCWHDLAMPLDGHARWQSLDGEGRGGRCYADLAELAAVVASRVEPDRGAVAMRYERVENGQIIEVHVESIARPGSVPVTVVMALDVTDRVRAERELIQAREALAHQERMRAMGELASGVAHDLNNVLGTLVLRLALLRADPATSESHRANIDAMARMLKDAAARVNCLQDFARRPATRMIGSVDLGHIIRESIELVRTGVEEKTSFAGAPIRIESSVEELPRVSGVSAAELRHMFINLILNARDAMPNGGVVFIQARRDDERVIVEVADEGTGIPEEYLTKIFLPFFTTKGKSGTGLGLSNAYTLMTELGGSIDAANRTAGGAVFTLTFPAVTDRSSFQPKLSPMAAPGQRILVIDDDLEHLQTAKAVIELEDQQVDVAQSGREAIARLRTGTRYDLVLCDAGMPELNGWQVAEEIRAIAPETRIYLLTGWAQQIAENDPRRSLVDGVLPKPMSLNRIRSILSPQFTKDAIAP